MTSLALGAPLAAPPKTLAELTLTFDAGPISASLQETRRWEDKGLAPDSQQRDPVTTRLTPNLVRKAGVTTFELVGYRLSEHEVPADTRVTMVLLVEVQRSLGGEHPLTGFWYEDHQEVPTSMWQVEGSWARRGRHAGTINLVLFPVDDVGPGGAASGLVRVD